LISSIIDASEVDLPEPGRAGHEHEAARLLAEVVDDGRQAQVVDRR
jgi:hypothetical protein